MKRWPLIVTAGPAAMPARAIPVFTFGLGASKMVREIDIKWPSRIHQVLRDVPADQILTIKEPAQ
ncbi:MAG: ASPIC/UnbV domain-containing protein [Bryobacteraceae bacterium]